MNADSLTGEDINEGTLGQVPQAATAARRRVNGITRPPQVTVGVGQTQVIATKGPLTLSLVVRRTRAAASSRRRWR